MLPGLFIAKAGQPFLQLYVDVVLQGKVLCEISGTAFATEDTAPSTHGAVPVGTGHMGIQGYFVTFMTECLLAVGIQGIVGLIQPEVRCRFH